MLHMARELAGGVGSAPLPMIALAVVLVVAAGVLLHVLIERPFLKLRERCLSRWPSRKQPQSIAAETRAVGA
jgi:peptidoglycan/LPS O-acetylase OafA/YrhL